MGSEAEKVKFIWESFSLYRLVISFNYTYFIYANKLRHKINIFSRFTVYFICLPFADKSKRRLYGTLVSRSRRQISVHSLYTPINQSTGRRNVTNIPNGKLIMTSHPLKKLAQTSRNPFTRRGEHNPEVVSKSLWNFKYPSLGFK